MRGDCSIRVGGVGFSAQQISAAAAAKRLLSIELDLQNDADCPCEDCQKSPGKTLIYDEILALLQQARDLGALRCILVDSPNQSYRHLPELIAHLNENRWEIELFTPDREIPPAVMKLLHRANPLVVIDSIELSSIPPAILSLQDSGHARLALRTTLGPDAPRLLPAWWRNARRLGIEPLVQVMTPADSPQLLAPGQIRSLFEELHRIDRDEFGIDWQSPPELTGRSCHRHQYAVHITPCGNIYACVGITIPLGNIRTQPLGTITDESEVLENLRDYLQKVKAPCRACSQTVHCYGCRGSAYQLTGDYLAGDRLCWKSDGVVIPMFPMPAGEFIPHGPGVQLVDQVLSVGERLTRTDTRIQHNSPFVDGAGRLEETAFIEMIAQSFAASHGVHLTDAERAVHRGMLIGVKNLIILGEARSGERLITEVRKVARFGDFGVVEGTVSREDGTVLARGEIKVWRSAGHDPQAQST